MDNDKKKGDQDKGFVVRDKRFSAKKEGEEDSRIKDKEEKREEAKQEDVFGQDTPLPEINFSSLIFSLSTSVLIQLGEVQDPNTQQPAKNLPLAKQTIDLIGMLQEKTKGNLTSDEEKLLENILYDLRLRYVKAVG
ncbi:MAG: DUF1844 domain-containing protein [Thermodesulfobacteriota bacterium]